MIGDWITFGHDAQRSGVDPTSPAARSVAPAWTTAQLDGDVYAQPLVVGSTLIVATEHDTVYAFDAATGVPRWVRHLGSPVPGSALPCGNIDPSGITGTPVVDRARQVVWVVSFSRPAGHMLWGLGAIQWCRGQLPKCRPARGEGRGPAATRRPGHGRSQRLRPLRGVVRGLLRLSRLAGGRERENPSSPAKLTYQTPTARSAIWAPPGAGRLGREHLCGDRQRAAGGRTWPVRQRPAPLGILAVQATFTPGNFASLSATDRDLGSPAPALLPGGLVFQIGKEGVGYLLHAADLGGIGGQVASGHICNGGFGGTAVDGETVFLSCFTGLYAVRISAGPSLRVSWSAPNVRPGPPTVAGGVVWAVDRGGALLGYSEASGARVYDHALKVARVVPEPGRSRSGASSLPTATGWLPSKGCDGLARLRSP